MDESDDVFAGLTDFCDNYSVDVAAAPRVVAEVADLSDSEEENRFLVNKEPPAQKNQVQKTAAKKTVRGAKKDAMPKSPAKSAAPNESDSDATTASAVRQTRSNYTPAEFNIERPAGVRRRSGRKRGSNMTIEEHMFHQTLAILNAEFGQPPAHRGRGRGRGGRTTKRSNVASNSNATTTQICDLTCTPDSPMLPPSSTSRTTEIVCLESDDDLEISGLGSSNTSFDIENAEIKVKVKWGDKIECVPHRKHQKFADLMKKFADRENVELKDIFLNLNDRIIEPDDTPDSIDYKIFQFLSGRIVRTENFGVTKKKDPNSIRLKIQSDAFKRPMDVYIKREQAFKILYIKCSEELHVPCDLIKLSFDGDPLVLTETPKDLELEGGEMVDCRIVK